MNERETLATGKRETEWVLRGKVDVCVCVCASACAAVCVCMRVFVFRADR
jgi:hypothetical protein